MSQSRMISLFVAAACLLAAPPVLARSTAYDQATKVQELMSVGLAGDPTREVTVQLYTIPPGKTLPWHIHPGAQEIAYVVQGRLDIETKGQAVKHLKTGSTLYTAPDQIHRGINPSKTEPVKLYVVRIKPKHRPATEEVDR